MNWTDYCPLALRTEAIPSIHYAGMAEHPEYQDLRKRATRLMHAAAGLVTETQELADAETPKNVAEELGDCFWYLPIIADCFPGYAALDHEMVDEYLKSGPLKAMQHHAAELLNYTLKRHVIYGKELEVAKVTHHAEHYAAALIAMCKRMGVKPGECMEANIKKLEKRYPKLRFDVEDTSNRNVEHELSHIQPPPFSTPMLPDEHHPEVEEPAIMGAGCYNPTASVIPAIQDMHKLSDSQKIATVEAMMSDAGYYLSPYAQKELGIKRVMPILDMRKIIMGLIPDNIVLDAHALHVEENAAGDICIKLVATPLDSVSYDEIFEESAMLAEMDEPVTYEGFCYLLRNEMTEAAACTAISTMALVLSNSYRRQGANALAEGFKAVYVNVMSNAKLELVIEDGFQLLRLLYPDPFPAGMLYNMLAKLVKGAQDAAE